MANLARFTVAGDPSANGGYEVSPSDTPALALESSAALVQRATYRVAETSAGAPALTLDNGTTTGTEVDAATPGAPVTVSAGIPSDATAAHSWVIECKVNGGKAVNAAGVLVDSPDMVFRRGLYLLGPLGVRKVVAGEVDEFGARWGDGVLNGLVDAFDPATVAGTPGFEGTVYTTNDTVTTAVANAMVFGSLAGNFPGFGRIAVSVVVDDGTDRAFIERIWSVVEDSGGVTKSPAVSPDEFDDLSLPSDAVSLQRTVGGPLVRYNVRFKGLAATNLGWSYKVSAETRALPGGSAP